MKKAVVYGTGASAEYFYQHYSDGFEINAIVDKEPGEFFGHTVLTLAQLKDIDYEFIVIASWAVEDIGERILSKITIGKDKLLWFQHNKNRIVDYEHADVRQAHSQHHMNSVLYAYYDLNVARSTYDILGFLCLADIHRQKLGLSALHIVIVSAENNAFNVSGKGVINIGEHHWRKRQILIQCCGLLDTCQGYSLTTNREEARLLERGHTHVFPQSYSVDQPVACWEFNFLFDSIKDGHEIRRLSANSHALAYVQDFLNSHNPEQKHPVTITLRQSEIKPLRNSEMSAWKTFINALDKSQFFPVVVPDTENAWLDEREFEGAKVFSEACFNVEIRMALYESSLVNLGVNNGPMHLCALSKKSNYLMFKQIIEDYVHTSSESFVQRGFNIGGDFPGAGVGQTLIWEHDTLECITQNFESFLQKNAHLLVGR